MPLTALLATAYAIPTVLVVLMFARYGDHTWTTGVQWAMLYFVALVQPFVMARRALRQFDRAGVPANSSLRHIAYYPVIVGGLALAVGLNMVREAALR